MADEKTPAPKDKAPADPHAELKAWVQRWTRAEIRLAASGVHEDERRKKNP